MGSGRLMDKVNATCTRRSEFPPKRGGPIRFRQLHTWSRLDLRIPSRHALQPTDGTDNHQITLNNPGRKTTHTTTSHALHFHNLYSFQRLSSADRDEHPANFLPSTTNHPSSTDTDCFACQIPVIPHQAREAQSYTKKFSRTRSPGFALGSKGANNTTSIRPSLHHPVQNAKMTETALIGEQEMDPQASPNLTDPQLTVSRRSSDIEYEVAHQLIQHAQGKSDPHETNNPRPPSEPGPSDTTGPHHHNDQRNMNGKSPSDRGSRCSTSQDRMSESQYAPLKNPPVMGQMCT